MKQGEIRVKIKSLMNEAQMWSNILEKKSCTDCQHFQGNVCEKWDATPPEETIRSGCEEWNWDEIPF